MWIYSDFKESLWSDLVKHLVKYITSGPQAAYAGIRLLTDLLPAAIPIEFHHGHTADEPCLSLHVPDPSREQIYLEEEDLERVDQLRTAEGSMQASRLTWGALLKHSVDEDTWLHIFRIAGTSCAPLGTLFIQFFERVFSLSSESAEHLMQYRFEIHFCYSLLFSYSSEFFYSIS